MGFLHVGQAGFKLLTSNDLPDSAFESVGITGVSHHAWLQLIFWSFVESRSLYVAQAGPELLALKDPPAWASQSAGIIGVSYHTWPLGQFFNLAVFLLFCCKNLLYSLDTRLFL